MRRFRRIIEGRERVVFIPTLEMSQQGSKAVGAEPSSIQSQASGDSAGGDSRQLGSSLMEPSVDSGILDTTRVEDIGGGPPTLWRRVVDAVLLIRLEIFLALFIVSRFMTMTPIPGLLTIEACAFQDLLLQKACLNRMHYNESICSHLDDYEDIKDRAEKAASMTSMIRTVISLAPGAVIAIFVGPWCDKYGYRTPLLSAMTGFLISTALTMMTVYHMWMPLYVNILSTIPDGLSGGFIAVFTAIYTVRPLSAGRMVLYVAFVIACLSIVWVLVAIKDLVKPEHAQDSVRVKIRNLFDVSNLADGFRTSMKSRPNKGKTQLWCLFGAICCVVFDLAAMGTMYYYVRKMYSWTVAHYATVSSISSGVQRGAEHAHHLPLRQGPQDQRPCHGARWCLLRHRADDYSGSRLQGVALLPALCGRHPYLPGPGKVFAFLASFDAVVPVLGEILITSLFNWSIGFFPGLPYLVAAGITFISAALIGYVAKIHKEGMKYEDMPKEEVPVPIND
ncbi:hypothetical protein MRX96_013989 [Rhipicephalus microplus]